MLDTTGRELMVTREFRLDERGWPYHDVPLDVRAGQKVVLVPDTNTPSAVQQGDTLVLPINYAKFASMCRVCGVVVCVCCGGVCVVVCVWCGGVCVCCGGVCVVWWCVCVVWWCVCVVVVCVCCGGVCVLWCVCVCVCVCVVHALIHPPLVQKSLFVQTRSLGYKHTHTNTFHTHTSPSHTQPPFSHKHAPYTRISRWVIVS